MGNIFKSKKLVTVIIVLALFAGFVYFYFFKNTSAPQDSQLSSQGSVSAQDTVLDKELFVLLNQLRAMKFDSSVLSDKKLKGLQDFSQPIPSMPYGRRDPFLTIGNDPVPYIPKADDVAPVQDTTIANSLFSNSSFASTTISNAASSTVTATASSTTTASTTKSKK